MELAPCPVCQRHVRASEPRCPFCHASVGRRGGTVGAALIAAAVGLTGCGGGAASESDPEVPVTQPGPEQRKAAPPEAGSDGAPAGPPAVLPTPSGPPVVVAPPQVMPQPASEPRMVPAYGAPPPPAPDQIPLGKPGVSGRAVMSTPVVTGSLTSHTSKPRTLASIRTAMHRCYQAALAQDATARGKAHFRVQIDSRGTATEVASSEVSGLGPEAIRCMAEQLGALRTAGPSTISFDVTCEPS